MKSIRLLGYQVDIRVKKVKKRPAPPPTSGQPVAGSIKLHFGPGPNWIKPDSSWLSVDVEPDWGDIVVNFQEFEFLPLEDNSCQCVYGSHVFEHISLFKTPLVFKEIYRVLEPGGIFRMVAPDAEKSVKEYVSRNEDFPLFKRRKERLKTMYGIDYTLFECMRDDFISRSGQPELLGKNALAHQNAWDFETLCRDLVRAGFNRDNIRKMGFRQSSTKQFDFEGTYPSEANEDYRSLYVEVSK